MSAKILSILIILLLLCQCQSTTFTGNIFTADSNNKYHNNTIQCNDNQDCTIVCQDYANACSNAVIRCPTTGNCDITCSSSHNVCQHMFVTCPTYGDCTISCSDDSACESADINGQTSSSLTMTCDGDNTCQNVLIDGRDTFDFVLYCGTGAVNTCTSLTVFFPPNKNGEKKATIIAGDQCSAGTGNPIQFYAYNGWSDVDITDYIATFTHHIGTMHCGDLYNKSCSFKSDAWRCANINDVCNNAMNAINATNQTETRTISTLYIYKAELKKTETAPILFTILYVIISILVACLCCLAGGCLYYINLTRQKLNANAAQIVPNESVSDLPRSKTNFVTVHSISKSSIITANPTSPIISGASSKAAMMKPYKSYSNRSYSVGEQQTPQPSSPPPLSSEPVRLPVTQWQNTTATITSTIEHVQPKYIKQKTIPSTSTTTSYQQSISSNNNSTKIVYQQPPQHQVLQMMSMMNQSQPPSLSEFIKNTNYVINQNPIPPTATPPVQSSSGSRYSVSITKTRHGIKPTPTESMSTLYINSLQSLNDGKESDDDPNDIIHQLQMAMNCLVNSNSDNIGDENVDISVKEHAAKAYAWREPNILATNMDEGTNQVNK